MKMNDVFPSNYLKAADLQGRDVAVTISKYAMEKMGDDQKLVLYFTGKEKGLVCNRTNADRIVFCYGDDLDNWIGKPIVLGSELVTFQGKTTEAIRVQGKPKVTDAVAAAPAVKAEAPFDDQEIPF
jgi:hypothetical protein